MSSSADFLCYDGVADTLSPIMTANSSIKPSGPRGAPRRMIMVGYFHGIQELGASDAQGGSVSV
jgi:hypothetical protein